MAKKLFVLGMALAATGCAAVTYAFAARHFSRRKEAQQNKVDLATWEGEGGKSAPSGAHSG